MRTTTTTATTPDQRSGTKRRLIAALATISLLAAACGGDDDGDGGPAAATTVADEGDVTADGAAGEATGDDGETGESGEPGAEPTGDARAGGNVVFAAEQWPECLNPVTSCANASWLVWSVQAHVLPRLMELDVDGNYRASPVIEEAPSLENGLITEDPFTVTYRIRDDAVWSDGSPITSEDVRFTWRAILDTTGTLSTSGVELITDVDASDPKAAVLTFSESYAPWPDLFGGGTGFVLKADEFTDTEISNELLEAIPWSGGPWLLESWGTEEAVLVRNDAYWDADRVPLLDRVTFVPREDTDTEIIALQTGEVSAIFPQPSPGVNERLTQDGIDFVVDGGVVFEGLWPNQRSPQSPILAEQAVREALAFAIDRQEIFDTVMAPVYPNGEVLQCAGWVPTVGDWCGDDFADVTQDWDRAAQILTDAGWTRTDDGGWEKDGTPLVIEWNTVAGNKRREDVQALVQEQVADFGIRFDIRNYDAGELFQNRLPTLDFGMGLYAQVASPDPSVSTLYDSAQIPTADNGFSGQNSIAWDDETVTELVRLSDRQLDPEARLATIREIGAAARAEMAWIPLYQLPNLTAWRSDQLGGPIGDWTSSAYGGFANMYDWFLLAAG
ncbi:MAG: peptide ABC transporter substrate-binding protein [Ilumatobacter sp.]|nr:peptide ABC transporter substrate-binding protein [Ilumatobacter sp.]